jgi:hypothetical protein
MKSIDDLWNNGNEIDWHDALKNYWKFVKPSHLAIEKEFDQIDSNQIKMMNSEEWYEFLLNKYYFWKYTAPNRYATTTGQLRKYITKQNGLDELKAIRDKIIECNIEDVISGLKIAITIKGLGTAGASGLLAVIFPEYFGTVDQFVVKSLLKISTLPERVSILTMWPDELKIRDASILINIMKHKARELNKAFLTSYWTPRKIDMILWSIDR